MTMMETRVVELVDELIPEPHTTDITSAPPADWPFPNDHELWLIVTVGAERFVLPIMSDGVEESVYELLARVRGALGDWIAESKFGWGQRR